MKVGIIGGTFDPIHFSHINIAKAALMQFNLDEILFMISPDPPHKNNSDITPFMIRKAMVELAVKDTQELTASSFEHDNNLKYTADTLTLLKEKNPENDYYFIIGSDSLANMHSWYHVEIIFKFAQILVAKRADESEHGVDKYITTLRKNFNADIYLLNFKSNNISSTFIRNNVSDISAYVPEPVAEFIKSNNIYRNKTQINRWSPNQILDDLKSTLDKDRYEHTVRVADTAKIIAQHYEINPNTAYLAGILHDCAKCMSDEDKIELCNANNVTITKSEHCNPYLLHTKAGAITARKKYGITDSEILSAITWHTTGKPDMTMLEKIIFISDYIEPGRKHAKNLDYLRHLAYEDLDLTVYTISKDTLEHLQNKKQKCIDKNTSDTFLYYKNIIESRG